MHKGDEWMGGNGKRKERREREEIKASAINTLPRQGEMMVIGVECLCSLGWVKGGMDGGGWMVGVLGCKCWLMK